MSSLSWLGTTLCPPDCLVKSDIKAPSCTAIFRLRIVVLQCVRAGKVFCGLQITHIRIICPVRDVTHVRKCTRPSPAFPYCKRQKAGRGAWEQGYFKLTGSSPVTSSTLRWNVIKLQLIYKYSSLPRAHQAAKGSEKACNVHRQQDAECY